MDILCRKAQDSNFGILCQSVYPQSIDSVHECQRTWSTQKLCFSKLSECECPILIGNGDGVKHAAFHERPGNNNGVSFQLHVCAHIHVDPLICADAYLDWRDFHLTQDLQIHVFSQSMQLQGIGFTALIQCAELSTKLKISCTQNGNGFGAVGNLDG